MGLFDIFKSKEVVDEPIVEDIQEQPVDEDTGVIVFRNPELHDEQENYSDEVIEEEPSIEDLVKAEVTKQLKAVKRLKSTVNQQFTIVIHRSGKEMRVAQKLEYDINGVQTKTIKLNSGDIGDQVSYEIYVQLLDDCNMSALGFISANKEGTLCPIINTESLQVCNSIETKGTYLIMASGYEQIKLFFDGKAKALVKCIA